MEYKRKIEKDMIALANTNQLKMLQIDLKNMENIDYAPSVHHKPQKSLIMRENGTINLK